MSRRLDFNHDFRRRQAAYGVSVKDEAEWMKTDAAARWLQRHGPHALQKRDSPAQAPASSEVNVRPRKSCNERHADIDPCDPQPTRRCRYEANTLGYDRQRGQVPDVLRALGSGVCQVMSIIRSVEG
jgi:hypothetical protein